MSDEIRTAVDLRTSIVDQRGGIERFDGPQRRLLDALVFELAKKPNEIDVRAVTDLMAMLPRPVSAPERDNAPDPRQVMWEIYKTMRERGELGLKALPPEGGDFQHRIDELEGENRRLKAQLVGGPLEVPTGDIVPPGEIARDAGPLRGADDPPPRLTRIIEGKAASAAPAAAAPAPRPTTPAYDYNTDQSWRDHLLPDGTITPTPMSRGRWWGPV